MTPAPLRLALIEDQHLFRESLATSLASRLHIELVGAFATRDAALRGLNILANAQAVLVDIRLGTETAFDLVDEIRRQLPRLPLIWVSSVEEDFLLTQAFAANLPGFVHKEDSLEVLVAAIETVATGGRYYSESVLHLRRQHKNKPDHYALILSDREQEVLRHIGAGFSNEEAAAMLGLSAGTIQAHRRNIMARLDLHSAAELVAYAIRHGFTDPKLLRQPHKPARS